MPPPARLRAPSGSGSVPELPGPGEGQRLVAEIVAGWRPEALFQQPWERGAARALLGDDTSWHFERLLAVPPAPPCPAPSCHSSVPKPRPAAAGDEAELGDLTGDSVFLAKLDRKRVSNKSLKELNLSRRERAIELWHRVLNVAGVCSALNRQLHDPDEPLSGEAIDEVIRDVFAKKSTATLMQRAYHLLAYARWAIPVGKGNAFPITEQQVYDYLRHLRDVKAAPTRAASFLSSVTLAQHLIGLEVMDDFRSARVEGAAARAWMEKRVRRPRDALTASVLAALEDMVVRHPEERVRAFV